MIAPLFCPQSLDNLNEFSSFYLQSYDHNDVTKTTILAIFFIIGNFIIGYGDINIKNSSRVATARIPEEYRPLVTTSVFTIALSPEGWNNSTHSVVVDKDGYITVAGNSFEGKGKIFVMYRFR